MITIIRHEPRFGRKKFGRPSGTDTSHLKRIVEMFNVNIYYVSKGVEDEKLVKVWRFKDHEFEEVFCL